MESKGLSKIAGIGAYLPSRKLSSEEIMSDLGCSRFGTPENYISAKIGIKERRVADDDITPADMAIISAEQAIQNADIDPLEIDLLIYCGIEKKWAEPSTAHFVQEHIKAHNAVCLDLGNACQGFLNSLSIADAYIATSNIKTVLVCTGEKPSTLMFTMMKKIQNFATKKDFRRWLGAFTTGDAGGAMVVQANPNAEHENRYKFKSDGQHAELCYYHYGENGLDGQMLMSKISKHITRMHKNMINHTYEHLTWTPTDIDRLYCHQVGAIPHLQMAKLAGIPIDKAPSTYENFGNLTTATFPVIMSLNPPSRGERLLLLGTGSGLSICQAGLVF